MQIPFIKAHGARNDFLLTWTDQAPSAVFDPAVIARAICDRHSGVGADGWILVTGDPGSGADGAIELWNSDGSRGEISGNGTRCAAALLVDAGLAQDEVRVATGAGVKRLRLLARDRGRFSFEMNMGVAAIEDLRSTLTPGRECVVLNVGNPQCAVFVEDFEFDWRTLGAQLESHPRFPNRTNVSFVRVLDAHTLEARFYERGAGETMSSGTGCTGAAVAAQARGWVQDPVRVLTPAGPLDLRRQGEDLVLAGPAEIVAAGDFYYDLEQDG